MNRPHHTSKTATGDCLIKAKRLSRWGAFAFILSILSAAVLFNQRVCAAAEAQILYHNDFEQTVLNTLPKDLQVVDGSFTVQQEQTNKFLQLPGAPLDSFRFLFGPTEKEGVTASARIYATAKGRRFPTFALGLNGLGGYRLQVTPAKKRLELLRGNSPQESAPFDWISGQWTHLRLTVTKSNANAGWVIRGKAWNEGQPEPAAWMLSVVFNKELPAGRAVLFGTPFSGTPIRFDDLVLEKNSNHEH